MKDEMKGRLKEVMDVAPWTTLDLSGEKGNAKDEFDYVIKYCKVYEQVIKLERKEQEH